MAVRPQDLETPERGMDLTNRGPALAVVSRRPDKEPLEPEEADELQALRARLEAARRVEPEGRDLHCRDCFHRGRDAAVRKIEGD